MAWSKRNKGDRNFFKFSVPGDELVGKWQGKCTGKYGDNGLIKDKEDVVHEFTLNAAISDLVDLDENTPVKVLFTGMGRAKNGNEFKQFDVFTWDPSKKEDDPASEFSGPVEPGADDEDEVPF